MLDHTNEVEPEQADQPSAGSDLGFELSESEEMYLITVAQLAERGLKQPIAISRLAKELSIQPVSANQMVHKLAEEQLFEYLPYKGVRLTPKGRQIAQRVLRHRRLWQVFLEEHLLMSSGEADALACRLEHITPAEVVNQLADFLGNPRQTAQGLPIPDLDEETQVIKRRTIAEIPVGQTREVVAIEADPATRAYLEAVGLFPGQQITPLAADRNAALLIQVGENRVHLAAALTGAIFVN